MSKSDDINTLFSLLDRKPEGTYQDRVVNEQLSESKNRWPIFDLSDEGSKGQGVSKGQEDRSKEVPETCIHVEMDVSETPASFAMFAKENEADKDMSETPASTQEVASIPVSSPTFLQQGLAATLSKTSKVISKSQPRSELKEEPCPGLLDRIVSIKESKNTGEKPIPSQSSSLEAVFSRIRNKNKSAKTSVFDKLVKK